MQSNQRLRLHRIDFMAFGLFRDHSQAWELKFLDDVIMSDSLKYTIFIVNL